MVFCKIPSRGGRKNSYNFSKIVLQISGFSLPKNEGIFFGGGVAVFRGNFDERGDTFFQSFPSPSRDFASHRVETLSEKSTNKKRDGKNFGERESGYVEKEEEEAWSEEADLHFFEGQLESSHRQRAPETKVGHFEGKIDAFSRYSTCTLKTISNIQWGEA